MDGETDSIAIFHGPHGYVSPTWYSAGPAVPTWNYAVIHAHGRPSVREDEVFLNALLGDLLRKYEDGRPRAWRSEDLTPEYRRQLFDRIVGFEMPIARLEAKFKLGQNRAAADRVGTMEGLAREDTPEATRLAEFMRSHLKDG
jgi:transcriptional regulator